jgi:hypothetical protein
MVFENENQTMFVWRVEHTGAGEPLMGASLMFHQFILLTSFCPRLRPHGTRLYRSSIQTFTSLGDDFGDKNYPMSFPMTQTVSIFNFT